MSLYPVILLVSLIEFVNPKSCKSAKLLCSSFVGNGKLIEFD